MKISTPLVALCTLVLGAGVLGAGTVQAKSVRVQLSTAQLSALQQVNSHVNATVAEVSDWEQYGRADHWALPTSGKGDCEDFALLKRELLVRRGFPRKALSVGVGLSPQGQPHAVLLVATSAGDYVLDSLHDQIVPLQRSGFTLYSQQTAAGFVSRSGAVTATPTVDLPVAAILAPQRVARR